MKKQTVQEIYETIVLEATQPCVNVGYAFKDKRGIIHLGNGIAMRLKEEDKRENLERMSNFEKSVDGFMFWSQSIEGKAWWEGNSVDICNSMLENYNKEYSNHQLKNNIIC